MSQNPTENLRRGRRRIEEIPEIILLKDWTWDVVTKRFYLHIRVCLDHDGKDIPRVTEWFVTAETVYPFGTIAIYPSCKNSITNTFPHQSINAFEEENHLWRKGKLCVDLIDLKKSRSQLMNGSFGICKELFCGSVRLQKRD